MTAFQRNLSRFSVAFHTVIAAAWAVHFTNHQCVFGLLGFACSVAFALYSVYVLRDERKGGVDA